MHIIQQKLLRLIETCNIGTMSYRDLGKLLEEVHPQVIKHHLEQLERKGLIIWDREKKEVNKIQPSFNSEYGLITIPILGSANCGVATLFANESIQGHIKISSLLLNNRKNVFGINAVGSSMNLANINGKVIEDGDIVIIDPNDKDVKSGDFVLSIIDDVANIKKVIFDFDHEQIILQSVSTYNYPPIYIHSNEADKYIVNGKVVQVIKSPKEIH